MKINIELQRDASQMARRVLTSVREVDVTDGSSERLSIEGTARPFVILPRPQADRERDRAVRELAQQVPRGTVGLVVAPSIPLAEREQLERCGLSWADGRGALHLSWPKVLVHIDRAGEQRARPPQGNDTAGLGPVGIRAVQVLLGADRVEWTIAALADAAAISTGQAHNVFRLLERSRLVRVLGKGPRQRRIVEDRPAALDWLASVDRARRRPAAAATYLYARTARELLLHLAERADAAGVGYAVTAGAASRVLGVAVLSNILVTQVRVATGAAEALELLGLERLDAEDAGRGMNLELWTDVGELGTFGASVIDGVQVAPPIRVWLDLARLGGRSDDAARLFREQLIERA